MKQLISTVVLALWFSCSSTVFANEEKSLLSPSGTTLRVEADKLRSEVLPDGRRVVLAEGSVKLRLGSSVVVTDAARIEVDRDGLWVVTADSLRKLQ